MPKLTKKKVEKLYNDILRKHMIPLVGNDTTFMSDLHKAGKQILGKDFIGVFASDQIPSFERGKYAILNLDNSSEPGSHWIAVAKHKDNIIVYDSFGRPAKKIIPSLFQQDRTVIDTELDAEQRKNENNCGARSLTALIMFDGYDPIKIAKYL